MKILFKNADFHLLNPNHDIAKAMLVTDGKIAEVYFNTDTVLSGCEIIDLQGTQIYPGFIDTHTHSFEGGLYSQSLNLSSVCSIKEVLAHIDDYCNAKIYDKVEQIDAFRFDENTIAEKRFPYMSELDKVCPEVPLVLRRIDGHSSVLNTAAWNKFYAANMRLADNILQNSNLHSKQLPDNFILHGALNDSVVHWYHSNCDENTILKAYRLASDIALSNGITTVHTMVGDAEDSIMHYEFIRDNLASFDVEFILYPQSFNIRKALDAGATRIGGCILADGALGSHTAALTEPYSDNPLSNGLLYHDNQFWHDFISNANSHGLQVAVHCIGDKAIKQINDIYLEISKRTNTIMRNQLIHCELTPDALLNDITLSGAIPVMQPAFDKYWGGPGRFYEKVLGNDRTRLMNRFKSFIDKGVMITGGSDWYITELDALQGVQAAHWHSNENERISSSDALAMYTINAAHLSGDENRLGKLSKGFDADFVCLSTSIGESDNQKPEVIFTFKKGIKVYSNDKQL